MTRPSLDMLRHRWLYRALSAALLSVSPVVLMSTPPAQARIAVDDPSGWGWGSPRSGQPLVINHDGCRFPDGRLRFDDRTCKDYVRLDAVRIQGRFRDGTTVKSFDQTFPAAADTPTPGTLTLPPLPDRACSAGWKVTVFFVFAALPPATFFSDTLPDTPDQEGRISGGQTCSSETGLPARRSGWLRWVLMRAQSDLPSRTLHVSRVDPN